MRCRASIWALVSSGRSRAAGSNEDSQGAVMPLESGQFFLIARCRFETCQLQGHTVGKQLTEQIARLEEVLMPLLERCHRMIARSIAHLEAHRGKAAPSASVMVNQAGQVNVDCAVMNKAER
jgi:hypothetical protein